MSEKKRTPYQQEMDELHVPEEKANETMRMMLAENRRLREKEAGRSRSFAVNPKFWGGFAAAAAVCAALLLAILPGRNRENYIFSIVDYRSLPMAETYRAEADNGLTLEDALGVSAGTLFPGWDVLSESTIQISSSDTETLYSSQLALLRGDLRMNAEVTNARQEIDAVIPDAQVLNGRKIRLAKDQMHQMLFAIYQEKDLSITLSTEMSENEMIGILKELLK